MKDRHLIYILGNMCGWLVALVSLGVERQSMGRGNVSATRLCGVGTAGPEMQNMDVTFPLLCGVSVSDSVASVARLGCRETYFLKPQGEHDKCYSFSVDNHALEFQETDENPGSSKGQDLDSHRAEVDRGGLMPLAVAGPDGPGF